MSARQQTSECPTCGKEFKDGDSYDAESRMRIHHSRSHGETLPDREYECPHCPYKKLVRRDIEQHIERVHQQDEENAECPTCEALFHKKQAMNAHHAQKHGERLALDERVCECCGSEFHEYESRISNGRGVYCSQECLSADGRVERECVNCGREMVVESHRAEQYDNLFCTKSCDAEWRSSHLAEDGHPMYVERIKVECASCSDTLLRRPAYVEKHERQFCDSSCHWDWISEHQSGSDSPHWKGGEAYYGEEWSDIRLEAIERDGGKCTRCGATRQEVKEALGHDLDVHHIIPLREFDELEAANELENLVTLCRRCHRKVENWPVNVEVPHA